VGGQWLNNQYTYTAYNNASGKGVITIPTPGSTFTGSSVTFDWTAGAGASAYWLDVGSSPGGNQYYQSGNLGNVLTTTVNGLPIDGSTVYVTLYSLVGAQWLGNSYTYTAFNQAGALGVMQTPIPGSTLSGNIATFTWSAGTGATAYWLDIGSVPGGNQYYQSGNLGNVLTTTVYSLPADGSTIYATLYSYVGGQWLSNAYTYVSGP
jgi:NADH:ubiquinone oxidoreductase subunit